MFQQVFSFKSLCYYIIKQTGRYFNDIDRLAYHMYHVETGQFVILDREFYRVLLSLTKKVKKSYRKM